MKPVLLPTVRYPRTWFFTGLALALLVTIACLVPGRDLPALGISDKLEHAVAYLVLAFWFASVMPHWDYLFLMLALLALGGGIEIAQGLMGLGREADLKDVLADVVGIIAGVGLALTPAARWVGVLEYLLARRRR